MTAPVLRDYQSAIVDRVRGAYRAGQRAPLVVLATGGGKTTIFAHIATSAAGRGKRVWIICHRTELVRQIAETLARFGCALRIIAPAATMEQCPPCDPAALVVVASVQSLALRANTEPAPDLIVCDEAHHAVDGNTWGRVLAAHPGAHRLLVTATPQRTDGIGLGVGVGGFVDVMIEGPTMRELQTAGHLCEYVLYGPPVVADLSGVKRLGGDYQRGQLAEAMDKPAIYGDAVAHYQRCAGGMLAVAFCASLAHAGRTRDAFAAAGVASAVIDGQMLPRDRAGLLADFAARRVQVLCSVDLIGEGLDIPGIEAAIWLRATESVVVWLQGCGRALRPAPGKVRAVILDHVGNWRRHGAPNGDREWSLDGKRRVRGGVAEDAVLAVRQCPACYAIHEPAPACPVCGHVEPVAARRAVRVVSADLAEVDADAVAAQAAEARRAQARARTVPELIATGVSRARAEKIVAARKEKEALVARVITAGSTERPSVLLSRKPAELRAMLGDA